MATHDHDFAVSAGARVIQLSDGRVTDPGDEPGEYLAEEADQVGRDR
jgi:hypothetical protein